MDVLAWVRKVPNLSGILVVILTSSEEPTDLSEAHRLGANSYSVKPPSASQLLDLAKPLKISWLEPDES
jgi:CheY-like chemotaxis protein